MRHKKRLEAVANFLADAAPELAEALRPDGAATPPYFVDFEVLRCIGEGGFGQVWMARNRFDEQLYSIKVLCADEDIELEAIKLFRKVKDLSHLVPILHVGEAEGSIYYVMPLADDVANDGRAGERYQPHSLDLHVNIHGKLDTDESLDLGFCMMSALAEIHRAGFVHRDLRPENILRFDGVWRLADPGLLTTINSDSPLAGSDERVRTLGNSTQADLFGLARTLEDVMDSQSANGVSESSVRIRQLLASLWRDGN